MSKRRFVAILSVVAWIAAAAPAAADDVYFHRPGAEWSQYETDVNYCVARTVRTRGDTQATAVYSPNLLAAVIGAAIGEAIVGAIAARRQRELNINYCMALHGWTVVDIDDLRAENNELIDVDAFLDERIRPWFSQPEPPVGRVILAPDNVTRKDGATLPAPITLETALAEQAARRSRRNRSQ